MERPAKCPGEISRTTPRPLKARSSGSNIPHLVKTRSKRSSRGAFAKDYLMVLDLNAVDSPMWEVATTLPCLRKFAAELPKQTHSVHVELRGLDRLSK
jgi:hypothetical protein